MQFLYTLTSLEKEVKEKNLFCYFCHDREMGLEAFKHFTASRFINRWRKERWEGRETETLPRFRPQLKMDRVKGGRRKRRVLDIHQLQPKRFYCTLSPKPKTHVGGTSELYKFTVHMHYQTLFCRISYQVISGLVRRASRKKEETFLLFRADASLLGLSLSPSPLYSSVTTHHGRGGRGKKLF